MLVNRILLPAVGAVVFVVVLIGLGFPSWVRWILIGVGTLIWWRYCWHAFLRDSWEDAKRRAAEQDEAGGSGDGAGRKTRL